MTSEKSQDAGWISIAHGTVRVSVHFADVMPEPSTWAEPEPRRDQRAEYKRGKRTCGAFEDERGVVWVYWNGECIDGMRPGTPTKSFQDLNRGKLYVVSEGRRRLFDLPRELCESDD